MLGIRTAERPVWLKGMSKGKSRRWGQRFNLRGCDLEACCNDMLAFTVSEAGSC